MTRELDREVRRRAGNACEYCRLPQSVSLIRFPIDHIIARQHGGLTIAENLALCCTRCNTHKGPNIAGIDPDSGALVPLYNPREEPWGHHFAWDGPRIVGLTSRGRVTILVLNMNDPGSLAVRKELINEGILRIPPTSG